MFGNKLQKVSRVFLLMVLVLSIVASSTACKKSSGTTSSSSSSNEKVTITYYHWGTQPQMQGAIDAYQALYPNVTVKYVKMTDSTTAGVNVLLTSGVAVDVVGEASLADLRQRTDAGMFEPLDNYMKASKVDFSKEFGPDIDKMYKYGGHYYAMPYCKSLYAIFYNKDLFDKAGVAVPKDNWTWDEFRQIAQKVTSGSGSSKIYGYAPDYAGGWMWPAQEALGPNAIYKNNTDKESNYDDPAFKYSLQLLLNMENVDKSAWPLSEYKALKLDTASYTMFFQGKVAMMPNVIADVKYVSDPTYSGPNPPKFNFGVANLPQYSSNDKLKAVYYTSDLSIPKSSKHKQEAYNFIKLFNIDRPDLLAKYKGNQTALQTSAIDPSLKGNLIDSILNYPNFDIASGKRVWFENTPVLIQKDAIITTGYSQIISATQNEMSSCIQGNESVDQCLANMKKQADAIIAKAKQP